MQANPVQGVTLTELRDAVLADFEAIDLTIRMPPDIQRPGGPLR